ncbi:MAG: lamin tail domain-containing protein, partial [Pedosphaera sp.]|nr:lamin tail domain-containing protein [Pedosphaera sp.]
MTTFHRTLLFCAVLTVLLGLPGKATAAETITITEFVASNSNGLQDEDGAHPDWIEIFNSGVTTVNLDGWFLTDSAANLTKWRIPATNIAPNGFVIVFASNKNRAVPGAPLHANFTLSAGGEYLALVHPDGVTIANEFSPQFPEQFSNISYGIGQNLQVTTLLSNTAPLHVFVPTSGAAGTNWTAPGFDISGTFIPGGTNYNMRFVSMTGVVGSPARILIYLGDVGDVYIDDLFLANGTNAEAGTNLVVNGNFETPLAGAPSLTNFFTSVG